VTRRAVLLLLVGVAAASVWLLLRRTDLPPILRTRQQNILVITIDTLRADALRMSRGPAATPNLERLAAAGARYSFAHAHAVYTLPSHATILTGEYPFVHGVRANSGFRLPSRSITLAERLRDVGFSTGAFVAAFPVHSQFGLSQGFDVYDDRLGDGTGPPDFLVPERSGDAVVAAARAWIAKQRSRWFAWVHLYEPHGPYTPPEPFARMYRRGPYFGEVAAADDFLGPLLDDLRLAPRRTLVIVTSDHGEGLGDHGEITHGLFAYETTLRVPLIVAQLGGGTRDPGDQRPLVIDTPARHIDLVPTVLHALKRPVPDELPGRSLLEWRRSARDSYFEAMTGMLTRATAPLSGVIADREKLIDLPLPELYDLQLDPAEKHNVFGTRQERQRVLEARLRSFGAQPPDSLMEESPEVAARLRALGYVSSSVPRQSQFTEADDPKRAVEIDADMFRAVWFFEQRQHAEAIAVYRSIVDRRPQIESAWRHMAFVQWQSGDRRGAIASLEEAIRRGVATDETRRQLAEYLETGAITPESGG
jgi:arylsulfatase A-like enzyme